MFFFCHEDAKALRFFLCASLCLRGFVALWLCGYVFFSAGKALSFFLPFFSLSILRAFVAIS